jgi:hypothetical protein
MLYGKIAIQLGIMLAGLIALKLLPAGGINEYPIMFCVFMC